MSDFCEVTSETFKRKKTRRQLLRSLPDITKLLCYPTKANLSIAFGKRIYTTYHMLY